MAGVLFTIAGDMLGTFRDAADSWSDLHDRSQRRADTKLSGPIGLAVIATSTVQVTLTNEGKVALGQFAKWDVLFEIQEAPGLAISYLTYTEDSSPAANRWTVQGIFLAASTATPEIVDPGILNPDEIMKILANPSPSVKADTYDRAVFVTPNEVTAEVIFKVVE